MHPLTQQLLIAKPKLTRLFQISYVLLLVISVLGGFIVLNNTNPLSVVVYDLAVQIGKIALLVYIASLLPGIGKRLSWQHDIQLLLMSYRRHIGIYMYLFVFLHYFWLRLAFMIKFGPPSSVPPFEIMGFFAHALLVPMVLTSNEWSVRVMGRWWNTLHKLTYIVLFLVLVHVALQQLISVWTILALSVSVLEVISFYIFWKRRKAVQIATVMQNGM